MTDNHVHQDSSAIRLVGALALGTLVIETACFWLFKARPAGALALHLTIVAALALWTFRRYQRQQDLRLSLLLVTATAFLGPLGAAGTLATIGLWALYRRSSTPFEQWYASMFPEQESKFSMQLYEQIIARPANSGERSGVVPFIDILSFGTVPQKQSAIALIADHFQPAFAPALKRALNDNRNAVRVQAAAAVSKVEKDFVARAVDLDKALANRPDDVDLLLAQARHYDEYAYTGILDSKREQDNREKASEVYFHYLRIRPEDLAARSAVGRLLLRKREFSRAANWMEEALQHGFSAQILFWYMESLFHLGRFAELRELARSRYDDLARDNQFSYQAMEAIRLWAGKAATDFTDYTEKNSV